MHYGDEYGAGLGDLPPWAVALLIAVVSFFVIWLALGH
jgi:hypothetical protein